MRRSRPPSFLVPRTLSLLSLLAATGLAQTSTTPPAQRTAVPFPQVRIEDRFFAPRRATNQRVTLRHALQQLEQTGTLANFDLAAAGRRDGFRGYVFQDSDAYKALEAVAYALAEQRDPELEASFDAVVARIAKAQRPDGYLNSWYAVNAPDKRFTNLRDDHELYCAGHLFEAAVAHFQATGKKSLLDVATRYADLLVATFGSGPGQHPGYCGHPEIELALVKLAAVTGRQSYFDLARHFVLARGQRFFAREHRQDEARYDGTYWLDHCTVQQLPALAGHAVRAAYLLSGVVDVAAATGDAGLRSAALRIWRNTLGKNAFVTGGIGPSASNEGFTVDYDLPTFSAYQESCASIAIAMWAQRMNLLTGDGHYADALETALYNAIPAGVQLDGTKFFYTNPLASRGSHHRREWFGCACCPPNLARTFAALGSYLYAADEHGLTVNLYVQGSVRARLGADALDLQVTTDMPWDGRVALRITAAPARPVALRLRQPAWSPLSIRRGGKAVDAPLQQGYRVLQDTWQPGTELELQLDLAVRALEADPRAEALRGHVAFARGPIVYCAEQQDHDVPVERLLAPPGTRFVPEARADLLAGVTVLRGELLDGGDRVWHADALYRAQPEPRRVPATLVPYAVWDNRRPGAMATWLPQAPRLPRLVGPEHTAAIELSFRNWNCDPEGLRDGEEPRRSGDTPPRNCHFWDHKGGTEWLQYGWDQEQALAGCRIYWFDDTGHGSCRLPSAARLSWRDGDTWRPVALQGAASIPIAKDRWCEVQFAPVRTRALRLEVDQQQGWSSGVLEWRLVAASDDDR